VDRRRLIDGYNSVPIDLESRGIVRGFCWWSGKNSMIELLLL